jgi:MFS family permease
MPLTLALFRQFFDVYLSSATIIGIATISQDLAMTPAEASWLINAYTLTLAAFLLAAGRISDMFSAKWTFVCGFAWVGLFCLGIGFSRDKTTIIVLRAFSGIGASATIPAALNLIVHLFPNDKERARAISMYVCA